MEPYVVSSLDVNCASIVTALFSNNNYYNFVVCKWVNTTVDYYTVSSEAGTGCDKAYPGYSFFSLSTSYITDTTKFSTLQTYFQSIASGKYVLTLLLKNKCLKIIVFTSEIDIWMTVRTADCTNCDLVSVLQNGSVISRISGSPKQLYFLCRYSVSVAAPTSKLHKRPKRNIYIN
jgi:hypothetical protein